MRLVETETDVKAGIRSLRRRCGVMRQIHDATGDPPLRRRAGGLEGLARIVIGQQVSIQSANAIWGRFTVALPEISAAVLRDASDETLTAAGLSGPKKRTLKAIARSIDDGLDLDRLAAASEDEVRAALTAITGIGPWTADIYLMFCLGRADAFAPGDLALQIAAGIAYRDGERMPAQALDDLAEAWRPWRSIAARLLWSYYAIRKQPASGAPV